MRPLFGVFDTETTGLTAHPQAGLKKQPRTIEFGGLITDGVEIIDTLEFICCPGIAIEQIITDITGLTNEDLDGRPPFEYFLPQMKKFFGQCTASIAHNHSFDRNILKYDLERIGMDLSAIDFPAINICTVEQSLPFFGYRVRLTELYNHFCGEYVQKHRALDDVKLLHEVCQSLGIYEAFSSITRPHRV